MSTTTSREDEFITIFLSAYDGGTWADAHTTKPDALDRTNPSVDKIAIRKSDGRILAIEHTIVEPFVGEKEDFASFEDIFLKIEADQSLAVPGHSIYVFVPVGALKNRPRAIRDAMAQSVHDWIRSHLLSLAEGQSEHPCPITGVPGDPPFEITLTVDVANLESSQPGPVTEPGILLVRRQQVVDNLGEIIEKALRKKLPKLVNTAADKRILLLERQHMNLPPKRILDEIEARKSFLPELARVDEIWILETTFYGTAFGGSYFRCELYREGKLACAFDFKDGALRRRNRN